MDDLISRQEAIEAISYSEIAFYPGDNEGDCLRRDSDIKQAIMELPSAEPERKLGRWLWGGEWDDGRNKLVRCSICNAADIQAAGVIVPYCWHCGAEMEVQDERPNQQTGGD